MDKAARFIAFLKFGDDGGVKTAIASPAEDPDENGFQNPYIQIAVHPALPVEISSGIEISLPVPELDEVHITETVRSKIRQKRRVILNHHRELWNKLFARLLEQLRAEQRSAQKQLLSLRFQQFRYRIMSIFTIPWAWFVAWPSWGKWMLITLVSIGVTMTVASGVGVYNLLSTTAAFADSPFSCGLVATLVVGCIFGIKMGLASIESADWRRRFRKALAILTALLTILFISLLALFTGGVGAQAVSVGELLHGSPSDSFSWLSPYLYLAQLGLEAVAALTVFAFVDFLVEKFGYPNRQDNPVKIRRTKQWFAASQAVKATENAIGNTRGLRRQLIADRKCFVLRAETRFGHQADVYKKQEDGIRKQRGESVREPKRGMLSRITQFFSEN